MYKPSDHTFAICAYGESAYLEDCIKSLRGQSIKTNTIMCTSTPNSAICQLAKDYNIQLYVNANAEGIASDWNFALASAKTPLVTIAHQDDIYCSKYAENILEYANHAKMPLLLFSDYDELRNGVQTRDIPMIKVKRAMLRALIPSTRWGSMFLRRRILSFGSPICCPAVTYVIPNLVNPLFSKGMRGGLDWEAWERVSKLVGEFVYIPKALLLHRIHDQSETTALIKSNARSSEDLEMFKRFWPYPIACVLNFIYGLSRKSNSLS